MKRTGNMARTVYVPIGKSHGDLTLELLQGQLCVWFAHLRVLGAALSDEDKHYTHEMKCRHCVAFQVAQQHNHLLATL